MYPELHLGPVTLQTFGLMFALAFLAAGALIARRLVEIGKPADWAYEACFSALVGGVVGSRVYRNCWYIFDRLGVTRVGFITNEGTFYKFDQYGHLGEKVYDGKVVTTGLKIFFGYPLSHNIDLEEIDPYK